MLRFITCGSVDDGKSTLIGRLLWESKQLFDDQVDALIAESKKFGTQGNDIDFALLVDGLSAEREQGITIDVAYRFFSTPKRKFIVADTPGHEQYTRNMVTGASTADLAVLLIDASKGILSQTRRHSIIASIVGIPHVVLAVNKMDLVNFDEQIFQKIKQEFEKIAKSLNFQTIVSIPLSALKGDNITELSQSMPWYNGPTFLTYLENVSITEKPTQQFIFPVQWVNRPDSIFRGFSGTIAKGCVKVNDKIRVTASGQLANVTEIVTMDEQLQEATAGMAVTLKLNQEIDISRGDVMTSSQEPLEMTNQFKATLVWMDESAGLVGRSYYLKLATQWASASITNIVSGINISTLASKAIKTLNLNDIAVCTLATNKQIVIDKYKSSRILGSFILVDRFTNATIAAGMIQHSLRRAQNIHTHSFSITRTHREVLNKHSGKVIWFTGLPGAGKSTLANKLEVELHRKGKHTYILDGDNVRHGLNKDLGFTAADRVENIRRIAETAKLMMDAGLIVMTAVVSPFLQDREIARELIGSENFIEVYVNTPLEICEMRDPKGLYKKARDGLIPNMSGINSPYEPPLQADIVINGSTKFSVEDSVKYLMGVLEHRI